MGNEGCVNLVYVLVVKPRSSPCAPLQAAAIHHEKVARREIGVFTAPKDRNRSKLMTPPPSGKEPERGYARVPISYSTLDSIGHCFQVVTPPTHTHTHTPLLAFRGAAPVLFPM